jgi:hypothetical protein
MASRFTTALTYDGNGAMVEKDDGAGVTLYVGGLYEKYEMPALSVGISDDPQAMPSSIAWHGRDERAQNRIDCFRRRKNLGNVGGQGDGYCTLGRLGSKTVGPCLPVVKAVFRK